MLSSLKTITQPFIVRTESVFQKSDHSTCLAVKQTNKQTISYISQENPFHPTPGDIFNVKMVICGNLESRK